MRESSTTTATTLCKEHLFKYHLSLLNWLPYVQSVQSLHCKPQKALFWSMLRTLVAFPREESMVVNVSLLPSREISFWLSSPEKWFSR